MAQLLNLSHSFATLSFSRNAVVLPSLRSYLQQIYESAELSAKMKRKKKKRKKIKEVINCELFVKLLLPIFLDRDQHFTTLKCPTYCPGTPFQMPLDESAAKTARLTIAAGAWKTITVKWYSSSGCTQH